MFGTRRRSDATPVILLILGVVGYLIIGTIILGFCFSGVWTRIHKFRRDLEETEVRLCDKITEVNDTLQGFVPCLEEVCEEFGPLVEVVMIWRGCWNATINEDQEGNPIVSGVGENAQTHIVCGGTNVTEVDGVTDWQDGDLLIFDDNTTRWYKNDGSPVDPNIIDSGPDETIIVDPTGELKQLKAGTGIILTPSASNIEISIDIAIPGVAEIPDLTDSGSGTSLIIDGTGDPRIIRKVRGQTPSCGECSGINIASNPTNFQPSLFRTYSFKAPRREILRVCVRTYLVSNMCVLCVRVRMYLFSTLLLNYDAASRVM